MPKNSLIPTPINDPADDARLIVHYRDINGDPCERDQATQAEVYKMQGDDVIENIHFVLPGKLQKP